MGSVRDRHEQNIVLIVSEERIDEYLGVGYLAAALRRAGFSCRVYQWQIVDHRGEIAQLLESAERIPLVGLTWLYDSSVGRATEISSFVKGIRPDVPVVVGGHPPSLNPSQALSCAADVDVVLRGEGDLAIVAMVEELLSETPDLSAIAGIAYRGVEDVRYTRASGQITDLDTLPWAERDTLKHVLACGNDPKALVARMCTSRGCYARCEFCSMVSFYNLDGAGMKWRSRDPKDVVAEMAHLVEQYGVSRFWFVDDEFLGPPREEGSRALAIGRELISSHIEIEWGFDTRANGVTALPNDGLLLLRESGLRVVAMGLESGSQAALKRLNKGMKIESNWSAVEKLRDARIDHRFGFIMYDPGTTFEDLALNVGFIRYAEPHRMCNTGPFRLLNAEYPEVGTVFAQRLGVGKTTDEALTQNIKPKLSANGLGYEFGDERVGHLRELLFSFASEVVEPVMIPRPANESALQADVWWQGANYLPQNVAAMKAFLDVYEWAIDSYDSGWGSALPHDADLMFDDSLKEHLADQSIHSDQALQ